MEEPSTMEMEPNAHHGRNRDDSSNTTAQLNISTRIVPERSSSQNESPLHIPPCFANTTEQLEVLAKSDTEGPLHTIEEHLALTNFYDQYMNLNIQQDTIIEPNTQNPVDPNTIIHDNYTNNSLQLPKLSRNIVGGPTYKSTYFNQKELSNDPSDMKQVALTRNIPQFSTGTFCSRKDLANISDDYRRTIQNDFHTRTLVENSAHSILDQNASSYLHNNLNIASQQEQEALSEHNPTTHMDFNVQHDGTAWEENLYSNILKFMENFKDGEVPSYIPESQDIFAVFSGSIHTTQPEITSTNSNQNGFQLDSRIIPRTSTTTVLKQNEFSRNSSTQNDSLTRNILRGSTQILEEETASPNFDLFNGIEQQGTVTINNSETMLETCLGQELWKEILDINSDIPLQYKASTGNGPEDSNHSLNKQNEFTNDIFDGMKNDAIYMPTTSTIPSNIRKMNNTMQNDSLAKNFRRRSIHSSKKEIALTNDIFDEMKKDGIYVPPSNIRNKNKTMQNDLGRSNHRSEKDIASTNDIFEDMKKDGIFIPTTSTLPSNIRNSDMETTVQNEAMATNVQENYTYNSAKRKALRTAFPESSANNTSYQQNESAGNNIKELLSNTPEPQKLTRIFPKYSRNRTVERNASTTNSNKSSLNTTSEHNASTTICCGNATINQNMAVRPKTTTSAEYSYTENSTMYSEDENACSLVALNSQNQDILDKSCQSSYSETNKIKERAKAYKSCQQNTNEAKSKKKRKVFRPLQLLPNNFQVNDLETDQYFRSTDDESTSDMYDQNPNRNHDRSHNRKYNRNPNHNYNKNYYQKEDHNCNKNHKYKNSENHNQTDDKNTKQQKKKNNEENKQNNPHKPRKKE